MIIIDYINGPHDKRIFGRSKYQKEIHRRLNEVQLNVIEYSSLMYVYNQIFHSKSKDHSSSNNNPNPEKRTIVPAIFMKKGYDILSIFYKYNYSHLVNKKIVNDHIKHITSQELAYLLKSNKLNKTIVTCYDLIPWIEGNRSGIWKDNMKGLKNADRIITISKYSKNEILEYVNYPEDRINIIYPAIDHDTYFPDKNKNIIKNIVPENYKTVLYVGSEQERQKLPFLFKAFAKLKKRMSNVKLIKIGSPQSIGTRENLIKLASNLNIQNDIIFIDYVPEEELPKWYNAADLFVYPCSYAGFGLSPLEAMGCGVPVITSNLTSLPEVVGDAGITISPDNIDDLTDNMYEVLTNDGLNEDMINKGLKRAKLFNWDKSAHETLKVYKDFIN